MTSAIDWIFRDRKTNRIVVAQSPNLSLGLWLVTIIVRWIFNPDGRTGTAVDVIGTAALVVWAADEVIRGVNPWRRFLGAAVLGGLAASWISKR
jgi:hypothetical protein